jgi:hypothetical protein
MMAKDRELALEEEELEFFDAHENAENEDELEQPVQAEASTWMQSVMHAGRSLGAAVVSPFQPLFTAFTGTDEEVDALGDCLDAAFGQGGPDDSTIAEPAADIAAEVASDDRPSFMGAAEQFFDAMHGEAPEGVDLPGDATMRAVAAKVDQAVDKVAEYVEPAVAKARDGWNMMTQLPQRLYQGVVGAIVMMAAVVAIATVIPAVALPVMFNVAMLVGFFGGFMRDLPSEVEPAQAVTQPEAREPAPASELDGAAITTPSRSFVQGLMEEGARHLASGMRL